MITMIYYYSHLRFLPLRTVCHVDGGGSANPELCRGFYFALA